MSRATVEAAEENIAPVVVAEAGRRLKCPRPDPMAAEAVVTAADIARAEVVEAEAVVAALLPAEAAVAVPWAAGIGSEIQRQKGSLVSSLEGP